MLGGLPGHMGKNKTRPLHCPMYEHYFGIIKFLNVNIEQINKTTVRNHGRFFFILEWRRPWQVCHKIQKIQSYPLVKLTTH